VKVVLMVQRLSGEKGTERIFPAMKPKEGGSGKGTVDAVLVIAGDGPSRRELENEARRRKLRTVFLGNVPHHDLPKLYRAADCFVTMSLSETFGLTSLEAMMCGCPAVMPFCTVFNEIWDERTLKTWRYNIESMEELASAINAAQNGGREWLAAHPVNMTWKMAADELLQQYEECIELTSRKREFKREAVKLMDHCLRLAVGTGVALWILKRYYMVLSRFSQKFLPAFMAF